MSVKEKLTAKIDLRDAIFGGMSIYVSVLLVTYLFIFGTGILLQAFGIINSSGEFLSSGAMLPENLYTVFISVLLAIFAITFFLVVLFEEVFFSKHEKGAVDLLGLGLVWGAVFVAIDAMVESFVMYISMYSGNVSYYLLSIRSSLVGPVYWLAVLYIVFLPVLIYYLRKSHKEHYDKQKLEKTV